MAEGNGKPAAPNLSQAALGPQRTTVRTLVLIGLGVIAAVAARCTPEVVNGKIEGRPGSFDGDSFFIGQQEVRMQGIDAPEGRQTCTRDGRDWRCGEEARRTLERLLAANRSAATFTRPISTAAASRHASTRPAPISTRACGQKATLCLRRLQSEEAQARPRGAAFGPPNSSAPRTGAGATIPAET